MPRPTIWASMPTVEEREVLPQPARVLRAAEGPEPVELEVPQVGDQERDRGVDVVPAHVEVSERQVQEDAVLVRTDLLAR